MSKETKKIVLKNILEALFSGKGEAQVVTGATGNGKSKFLGELPKSDDVAELLEKRIGNGQGTLTSTEVLVTNSGDLDENILYVNAKTNKIKKDDVYEENSLIGRLYHDASNLKKGETFEEKLQLVFEKVLSISQNDSLAKKISKLSKENRDELITLLLTVDKNELSMILNEVKEYAKNNGKKGKFVREKFTEKLPENVEVLKVIEVFWETLINMINSDIDEILKMIPEENKHIYGEVTEFTVEITMEVAEKKSNLISTLLMSEEKSKEYYFSKISLLFVGKTELFKNEQTSYEVMEINDKIIKVIRFIDTMGLLHKDGVETDDEVERIKGILSEENSDRLLFVISAEENDNTKKAYTILRKLLQESGMKLNIFVLESKMDLAIFAENGDSGSRRRRGSGDEKVKLENAFESVIDRSDKRKENLEKDIRENKNRLKPEIKGIYKYELGNGASIEIVNLLTKKGMTYENAIEKLLEDLDSLNKSQGGKIKTKQAMLDGLYTIQELPSKPIPRGNIYKELVDSKEKTNVHHANVTAVLEKWSRGDEHISKSTQYEPLHSRFVTEMGEFAKTLVNGVVSVKEDSFGNLADSEDFKNLMDRYLNSAYFGKKFAANIKNDAYINGYVKSSEHKMCMKLNEMLGYVMRNYFSSRSIAINKNIETVLIKTIEQTIERVIAERVIVIY